MMAETDARYASKLVSLVSLGDAVELVLTGVE
jgi:hypothetical protein